MANPGATSDWRVTTLSGTSRREGVASSVLHDTHVVRVEFVLGETSLPENVSIRWKGAHLVSVKMTQPKAHCTSMEASIDFHEGNITFVTSVSDFVRIQESYFDPK